MSVALVMLSNTFDWQSKLLPLCCLRAAAAATTINQLALCPLRVIQSTQTEEEKLSQTLSRGAPIRGLTKYINWVLSHMFIFLFSRSSKSHKYQSVAKRNTSARIKSEKYFNKFS